MKDFHNAISCLAKNGTIVAHDCNPLSEAHESLHLNGTVWKAWTEYRMTRENIFMFVVPTVDGGCGVIRRGRQQLFKSTPVKALNYAFLDRNRKQLLNLSSENWTSLLR
jgi:hypothetical protein